MSEASPVPWTLFLWPAVCLSLLLLILPQTAFVWLSFHEDVGLGQTGDQFTLANYGRILMDPFYLGSIWLTVWISAIAVVLVVVVGMPAAYALARTDPLIARVLVSIVLAVSLITVVIKLLGLNLILGTDGFINRLMLSTGLVASPLHLLNNQVGVVIGLIQYTLPLFIVLMFSVIQTVPVSMEEAAEVHGATSLGILLQVVLPLIRRGLVASTLICFNMNMGAFTSAVLMGGGRVLTLPVLIQQKIVQGSDYAMGAALSMTLLVVVFAINVAVTAVAQLRGRR